MITRLLLPAAGALLALSLVLPWFDGVSGWEHWAWADVVLLALAVALLAAGASARVRRAPVIALLVVLCGLAVGTVLGHGLEPRVGGGVTQVGVGPYAALAALTLGVVGGLAAWPQWGPRLLLAAGAVALVAAVLSGWGSDEVAVFLAPGDGERVERLVSPNPDGFARWAVFDVALLALAGLLLAAATGRLPRWLLVAGGVACVAATACVAVSGLSFSVLRTGEAGVADGPPYGPLVALLGLGAAYAGLALVRPPERSGRAG